MPQTLILAKNITEANRYARVVGLPRFSYRAVRAAGAIRGVRHAEVHLLSSFTKRVDRHSILGALRHAKTLEVFYVDLADFPEVTERTPLNVFTDKIGDAAAQADIDANRYPLDDKTLALAFRANAIFDSNTLETEPVDPLADLVARGLVEPEGFELSSDPQVQATQILASAAHFADEETDGEEAGAPEQVEDAAPPAAKRCRSRCKDCAQLHFSDEPCPPKAPSTPNFF